MKTLFMSLGFPGVTRVGEEGEKLGLWEYCCLNEKMAFPLADVYILGAWHPIYNRVKDILAQEHVVGVFWTSSLAEMELNAPIEFDHLKSILADPKVKFIWFGDPLLVRLYPEKGFHLPYPIQYSPSEPPSKQNIITLFCPAKPGKNIMNQLALARLLQMRYSDLVLHTNVDQIATGRMPGLRIVSDGWMERDAYHRLLASARLNLACSWTETFSYQAAEAVMLGTPCVLSPAIPWNNSFSLAAMSPGLMYSQALELLEHPDISIKVQQEMLSTYASLGAALKSELTSQVEYFVSIRMRRGDCLL